MWSKKRTRLLWDKDNQRQRGEEGYGYRNDDLQHASVQKERRVLLKWSYYSSPGWRTKLLTSFQTD